MLGSADIGTWEAGGQQMCMHADKELALKTMAKIRELHEMDGVHVALAHVYLEEVGDEKLNSLFLKQ